MITLEMINTTLDKNLEDYTDEDMRIAEYYAEVICNIPKMQFGEFITAIGKHKKTDSKIIITI